MDLPLPKDFSEFLKSLIDNKVRFLLVGGYAVVYHGYWRVTEDLDIWIPVEKTNASRVVEALRQFGFDVTSLSEDLFLQEHQILRMGIAPVLIEIHTSITGGTFEECFKRRVDADIEGVVVPIISIDDLRRVKAAGRPKDLADLDALKG